MDEELENLAQRYAHSRNITLGYRLGFGMHGIVFAAVDNKKQGFFAVKFHSEERPFERECQAYERLREENVVQVLGFNVPQLLRFDREFRSIEMTIVRRPFLLDFADTHLDRAPGFSEDILEEWEKERAEMFGGKWPNVNKVLLKLQGLGIYMGDINPGNIRFSED